MPYVTRYRSLKIHNQNGKIISIMCENKIIYTDWPVGGEAVNRS